MAHSGTATTTGSNETGWQAITTDWSADKQTFQVPWGKAMMWIFLLSDTFIFTCFLTGYMNVRVSTPVPWPNPSEVFALTIFGVHMPLILIAIMTFVLITSSGTMAMAVNFGYRGDRGRAAALMLMTAAFGAIFVGMQAFEWTKLIIDEGIRPWGNPLGASQFGATFFMITGFHGLHVSAGVIYLVIVALKVLRGDYERGGGNYEIVEIAGLYWHFVDLVWVFIFAFFYLWWGLPMAGTTGQQHPLSIYFVVWALLFAFSAASYGTDFLDHGFFRWGLILLFMALKAGFIVAIFMHMKWERLALIYAILGPPVVLLVLIGLMAVEGGYTELTRLDFFSAPIVPAGHEAAAH